MTTLSAVALGLNGGCCFAYAVLFGLMQTKLLEMYGVEVRVRARLLVTHPDSQNVFPPKNQQKSAFVLIFVLSLPSLALWK